MCWFITKINYFDANLRLIFHSEIYSHVVWFNFQHFIVLDNQHDLFQLIFLCLQLLSYCLVNQCCLSIIGKHDDLAFFPSTAFSAVHFGYYCYQRNYYQNHLCYRDRSCFDWFHAHLQQSYSYSYWCIVSLTRNYYFALVSVNRLHSSLHSLNQLILC